MKPVISKIYLVVIPSKITEARVNEGVRNILTKLNSIPYSQHESYSSDVEGVYSYYFDEKLAHESISVFERHCKAVITVEITISASFDVPAMIEGKKAFRQIEKDRKAEIKQQYNKRLAEFKARGGW